MDVQIKDLVKDAVDPKNTRANWTLISDICDRANQSDSDAKVIVSILESTLKRRNPASIHLCIAVAGTLVHNCNDEVKKLVFSRPFLRQLVLIITSKSEPNVTKQLCHEFIHRWAQEIGDTSDFRYVKIVRDELEAMSIIYKTPDKSDECDERKALEQEKEDIELAMAISLSETQNPGKKQSQPIIFRARTVYKYEPRDEDDLSLNPGDMIDVLDTTTYTQWWKGRIGTKEGFFPSNFVKIVSDSPVSDKGTVSFLGRIRALTKALHNASEAGTSSIVRDPEIRRTFLEITSHKTPLITRHSSLVKKTEKMIVYLRTIDEFMDLCTKCVEIRH